MINQTTNAHRALPFGNHHRPVRYVDHNLVGQTIGTLTGISAAPLVSYKTTEFVFDNVDMWAKHGSFSNNLSVGLASKFQKHFPRFAKEIRRKHLPDTIMKMPPAKKFAMLAVAVLSAGLTIAAGEEIGRRLDRKYKSL